MDLATARRLLTGMTAATTDPVLSTDELDDLLSLVKLKDDAGRLPSDDDWEGKYNLVKAAVEGWRWKAAKASELSNSRTGDLTFEDHSIFTHCRDMVREYQRRLLGSPTLLMTDDVVEVVDDDA